MESKDISTEKGSADNKPEIKTASIKKNYVYSLLNKLVAVLIPILITPYLARVLEPDGNGLLSYVGSYSSYFILIANVGIEAYGQRMIAIHRNNESYLKKFFYEITILRVILTAACLLVYYVLFISPLNSHDNFLYAVFALAVAAVIFDFSWFFQGLEDFRILAIANIITRAVYVAFVFIFVREKADITLAAFLSVINTILPFFLCLPFLFKHLRGKIKERLQPFSHFKECIIYFIPTIAVQIYTVLDKTMIGLITGSSFENGYYEQAEKIIKLPLTLITTLFVIMRSRISYYYSQEKYDDIKNLINKSCNVAFCCSIPLMLGIIAVAPTFVSIYLGEGYDKCILLLYIFSPLIPIISVSNLIGTHYYTPFNKQKVSNIFLIIGAVLNVALNSFLIFLLQSTGATIASVCAELVITVLYIIFARKFIDPKMFVKVGYKYLISSLVMFVPVFLMDYFLPETIWILLAEIGTGMVVYFIMLLILRVEFVYTYIRVFKNKISNIFKKKAPDKAVEGISAEQETESESNEIANEAETETYDGINDTAGAENCDYYAEDNNEIGVGKNTEADCDADVENNEDNEK